MDAVAQMVYPALCHQFFNDAAGVGGNLGLETAGFAAFLSLFFLGGLVLPVTLACRLFGGSVCYQRCRWVLVIFVFPAIYLKFNSFYW